MDWETDCDLNIQASPLPPSPVPSITPSRLFPVPPKKVASVCVSNQARTFKFPTTIAPSRRSELASSGRTTIAISPRRGVQFRSPKSHKTRTAGQQRSRIKRCSAVTFNKNKNTAPHDTSRQLSRKQVQVKSSSAQTTHIKKIHQATQTNEDQGGDLCKVIKVLKVNQATQTPPVPRCITRRRIQLSRHQTLNINIHLPRHM